MTGISVERLDAISRCSGTRAQLYVCSLWAQRPVWQVQHWPELGQWQGWVRLILGNKIWSGQLRLHGPGYPARWGVSRELRFPSLEWPLGQSGQRERQTRMEQPSESPENFTLSDGLSCCRDEAHWRDLECFLFPDGSTSRLGCWPFCRRSTTRQQWESFYDLRPLCPELLLVFWLSPVVEDWVWWSVLPSPVLCPHIFCVNGTVGVRSFFWQYVTCPPSRAVAVSRTAAKTWKRFKRKRCPRKGQSNASKQWPSLICLTCSVPDGLRVGCIYSQV